jgi:ribosome-associated protein
VTASRSLSPSLKARLLARPDARLSSNGVLTITARRFREQARNRADARARLVELLRRLSRPKKPRRHTRPPLASKKRRAEAKERRGRIKKNRARPAME